MPGPTTTTVAPVRVGTANAADAVGVVGGGLLSGMRVAAPPVFRCVLQRDVTHARPANDIPALVGVEISDVPGGRLNDAEHMAARDPLQLQKGNRECERFAALVRLTMPERFAPAGPAVRAAPLSMTAGASGRWALALSAGAAGDGRPLAEVAGAADAAAEQTVDGPARSMRLREQGAGAASPALDGAAGDDAYVRSLAVGLRGWVDYSRTGAHPGSAYEVLRSVFHQHRQPLPDSLRSGLDLAQIEDAGLLDEAALLLHQMRGKRTGLVANDSRLPPLDQLRTQFLAALRTEEARHRMLDRLLAQPQEPGGEVPYFDGFALRNAVGKNFDQLLDMPQLWSDPALAPASATARRELLTAKFAEMGESTLYPVGTAQHSMASAMARIAKHTGQALPARFDNEQELFLAYVRMEQAWQRDKSTFPVHPRLLLSHHLARSNAVAILDTAGLQTRFERIMALAQRYRETSGDSHPLQACQYLRELIAGKEGPDKRDALLAGLEGFRNLYSGNFSNPPWIAAFTGQLAREGLLGEVLVGDDHKEKLAALLAYGLERLRGTFEQAPVPFSRAAAARAILKRYGMDDATLNRSRSYSLGVTFGVGVKHTGRPAQEFLKRVDAPTPLAAAMQVGSTVIIPKQELQQEEEAFNARLPSDSWVRHKAMENLRARFGFVTDKLLAQEIKRIAANLEAETENHRTGMQIFRTLLGLLPFVGSSVRLYEGFRDKDVKEIVLGFASLGLDAAGAAAGRSSSAAELPAQRRAGAADFHHVTTELDIPAPRITDHEQARVPVVELAELGVRDGNVPEDLRPLAARVRSGERGVTWQGHELVLLANEERVVPVKNVGGSYQEIDWRTGHRVPGGRLIQRDSASGAFRSDLRLRGGGWFGRTPVDHQGKPVGKRPTVTDLEPVLKRARDFSVRDFRAIFGKHFKVFDKQGESMREWADPARGISGEQGLLNFLEQVYRKSHTFRRLVNDFDTRAGAAQPPLRWDLNFGGRPLRRRPSKPATFPGSRNIDFPDSIAALDDRRYMSASGSGTYTKENMVVHEFIHALTDLEDPPKPDRTLNQNKLVPPDRGAVVYVTDKVLSEAGYDYDERMAYFQPEGKPGEPTREQIVQDVQAENRHLDASLDKERPPVAADTVVHGQPVKDRPTVSELRRMEAKLRGPADGATATAWEKLQARFDFSAGVPSNAMAINSLKHLVHRLLKKSPTFRALLDRMPERSGGKWKFEFSEAAVRAGLPPARQIAGVSGTVNRSTGEFYLFEDHSSYLSENGVRETEYARQVAQGFVHAMTDLETPAATADAPLKNRGGAVLLAERILKEAGFRYPQQLAAGRAASAPEPQSRLLAYWATAQRAAAVEDAFLAQPD